MDPVTSSHGGHDHLPAAAALVAVAALSDELRRRMYGFIRRVGRPVSREEAAKSVGISRKLGRLGAERALTLTAAALARHGFEPDRLTPMLLRLRNCPFHPLVSKAPQLICGINHAFLTGFLDALQASTVTAVLPPCRHVLCRTHRRLIHGSFRRYSASL